MIKTVFSGVTNVILAIACVQLILSTEEVTTGKSTNVSISVSNVVVQFAESVITTPYVPSASTTIESIPKGEIIEFPYQSNVSPSS